MTSNPHHRPLALAAGLAVAGLFGAACGDESGSDEPAAVAPPSTSTTSASTTTSTSTSAPVIDPGDGGDYDPMIDPADFEGVEGIDNPYLPFTTGSRWVYEGTSEGEVERIEVEVTDDRKTVMGLSAVVVRDTVTLDGELVEDTFDWYAQDRDGNVWYLGEDSTEYENGEAVNTAGSWEAGVDGALPGIVMPADPKVGDAYRQEFRAGVAEDMGEVLRVDETAQVAGDARDRLVVTEDWTPLEPDTIEEKYYAPGVGLVLEVKVAGGDARVELVDHQPGS